MTDDRSLERAARSWVEAGPSRAPDYAVAAALREIETTAQERGLRLPWRFSTMNLYVRLAGVALAAVFAIGVANYMLNPGSNVGGPPVPSSSPGPEPSPSPSVAINGTRQVYPTPAPVFPAARLPEPPGEPLTDDLIGRTYGANPPEVDGTQELILTLRSADDPHCVALYEGGSTCFTYLYNPNGPKHVNDPAARGAARILDGDLVLRWDVVPMDLPCEGNVAVYAIDDGGATLPGLNAPACTVPGFLEKEADPAP